MAGLVHRRAEALLQQSLEAFRVVVLHGARQAGKSTLARSVAARLGVEYVTLDRAQDLAAAIADPATFLEALGTPAVVDEIQRGGDPLVLSIKERVDRDQRPGQYLLTGSTNFLTVPSLSESLAGRVDLLTLWPLTQAEIAGSAGDLIERAFHEPDGLVRHRGATPPRDDYLDRLCKGGFPEAQRQPDAVRGRWFARYAETVIEREIESVADIRRGDALSRMLRLLAARTSEELVVSRLAHALGIDRVTAESYERWLETVFLVHRLPAWSRNLSKRVLDRPKIHASDTGLAAALGGKSAAALRSPTDPAVGSLVESFAVNELAAQLTWSAVDARLYHYRESGGPEVDIVVEATDGSAVAIEVKATTTPRDSDFDGLRALRRRLERVGSPLVCGILLHTGARRAVISDGIVSLPIADIWT